MKAVLLSIKPEYCELIASGEKTIEVRKTRPKVETPFKCYIYRTKSGVKGLDKLDFYLRDIISTLPSDLVHGKIIGEFICDAIITAEPGSYYTIPAKERCLMADTLLDYASEKTIYGWHISNLIIYDEPKELREFRKPCIKDLHCESCAMYGNFLNHCGNQALRINRPPQSWCYVEEK